MTTDTERSKPVGLAFAAIVLAMLPAVLDQTILATALPTIAADLGSVTDVSWVVTAYVIAAAATTPLWGKLGDRHGRRRLLEASLGLFLAASALCGLTRDITELIAARSVQGAAAPTEAGCVGDSAVALIRTSPSRCGCAILEPTH